MAVLATEVVAEALDNVQPDGCILACVTERDEDRADAWFHSLADRTRRDILRRVLAGEHSVSTLAASYDMSFAAVQKHVAVLERAGLLSKRRRGREQLASGEVQAVRSVASMLAEIEQLWRGRIARMDDLLADPDQTEDHNTKKRK
jgi:DNA-binding transcriptional ArsR family regulator